MAQFSVNRNPASGAPYGLITDTRYYSVIEDIQPGFSRIFVDKQGYDLNTLGLLNGKQWHFNNKESYSATATGNTGFQQSFGSMFLTGGSVTTFATSESNSPPVDSGALRWSINSYHLALDPANWPVRPFIKYSSNNIFYSLPTAFNATPATSTVNNGMLYGSDITSGAIGGGTFGTSTTSYAAWGNQFWYEDVTNGNLYTLGTLVSSNTYLFISNNYQSGTPSVTTSVTGTNADLFFLGLDSSSNPYYVTVAHSTANEPVTVSYINATSKAVTAIVSAQLPATSNAQIYNVMYPSNLRTDSSSRKVFYTMHWDSSNNLAPVQYIWGSGQVANISKVNCTLSYPGANTYANYGAHFVNTNAFSSLLNLYFCKPYQFTIGSNNYITFTVNDVGAGYVANSATRFANTLSRAWLTYQIGSVATSNDNVLTYHSFITSNTIQDMPHNWMPVPGTSGNTLAVATYNSINFIQFNTTTGWTLTNKYPGRSTGFGFDATGRMWAYMADGSQQGAGSVHIVTPTSNTAVPTNISIVYANSNIVFAGANVSTTANVNAYDYANNRLVANVTLTIDGGSMVFSNGAKTATITTSNSADTSVGLTITSGGTSSIIPSVNI
jgi:hypothetical protein